MLNLFTEVSELLPQIETMQLNDVNGLLFSELPIEADVPVAIAIAVVLNFVAPTK